MCFDVLKHRNCRYFLALHPKDHVFLPCIAGISNDLSRTLEVYRKVLNVSIVYQKDPCERLCIRQHYYRFELPRTLCISGDPNMIPYLFEKIPLVIFLGAIHWKQYSRRLQHTYPWGISWGAPSWQSWWETWLSKLLLSFKFSCLAYSLSREIFGVFSSFETLV